MADTPSTRKFSFAWWHMVIAFVVPTIFVLTLWQTSIGQKAIDKEHADSTYQRSVRFVQSEWFINRMRDQAKQEAYGPPSPAERKHR